MTEEEKKGLREEVEFLKDVLKENKIIKEEKKKGKTELPFKLPLFSRSWFASKLGRRKVKRNWIIVFDLYDNRNLTIVKKRIEDQTIEIDGIPRLATSDNIFLWNGRKPCIINRRYSVKPMSPSDKELINVSEFVSSSDDFNEQMKKGMNVKGWKVLHDKMVKNAIQTKKPMGNWLWIIIGLVVLGVVVYILWAK